MQGWVMGADMDKREEMERIESKISRFSKIIGDKARLCGGDPFVEHRIRRKLPEVFEYGMNCLLTLTSLEKIRDRYG
jgi:hypothetical protein